MANRLARTDLINKAGASVSASSLKKKIVFFYFSAHWCPPCRQFTPLLKQFYSSLKGSGKNIEIVFVSNDKSEGEMMDYFRNDHGDYLAIKYGDEALNGLAQEHNIKGIPTIVAVDQDGKALAPADEVRQLVVRHVTQNEDISSTLKSWGTKCGDWSETKGNTLGGGGGDAKKMSASEMRAARLAALEKRTSAAPASSEPSKGATLTFPAASASVETAKASKPKPKKPLKVPPSMVDSMAAVSAAPTARQQAGSSPEVQKLLDMGFGKDVAIQTLQACDGNVETAIAILLS